MVSGKILCQHAMSGCGRHSRSYLAGKSPSRRRRYGGAGAVWHIFRRQDTATLREYLARHCTEFTHRGQRLQPADVDDHIHSQVSLRVNATSRCFWHVALMSVCCSAERLSSTVPTHLNTSQALPRRAARQTLPPGT